MIIGINHGLRWAATIRLGNGLFDPREYPAPTQIAAKFVARRHFMPVAQPDDFRVQLGNAQIARIRAEIGARNAALVQNANCDLWQRVHKVTSHLVDRVSASVKSGRFAGSGLYGRLRPRGRPRSQALPRTPQERGFRPFGFRSLTRRWRQRSQPPKPGAVPASAPCPASCPPKLSPADLPACHAGPDRFKEAVPPNFACRRSAQGARVTLHDGRQNRCPPPRFGAPSASLIRSGPA